MAIGTAAAIIGGSVLGGLAQASGARSAARAQSNASDRDIAYQTETRDLIRRDLQPFVQGGTRGQQAYLSEFGLAQAPAGYQGFQESPGYQFALQQGTDAVQSGAAARGGLYSGAAMSGLNSYAQGMANQEYGNYLNRLQGIGANGQNAAGMQASASQNSANAVGNSLQNMGNAQAAGAIAQGNAWSSTIGNVIGGLNYMNSLNRPV